MLRKSWKLLVPELVCSAEDGRMRLHGIASSTVTDRHGDEITEKALRSMERQAVGQNIFLNHSWVMPEDLAGTVTAAQVQKASDGVWELHYDVDINAINQRAVDTWKAINNGTKLGISIEAMVPPNSTKRSAGGGIIIDDIELMGASFVAHPANTRAWTDYVVKSLTGYLPDKLRVMEATQGRDFYLKAAARANAEAMEDMSDDDAEPVAETESQVDAPEVIASDDPVVAAAVASDPPEVTDSADEPEVVFAAATVETAEVTPDVTDSTTTLKIDPDGTTTVWVENEDDADEASSKAASQDTSDTSPDTGSGTDEAGVLDDNGLDNEAILGDDVTKAMTAAGPTITSALDGQMILIRSLTDQVIDLQKKVIVADSQKDAALEIARDTIKDADALITRLLDSPMGRKTVVKEATDGMAHLRDVYGDQIISALSKS